MILSHNEDCSFVAGYSGNCVNDILWGMLESNTSQILNPLALSDPYMGRTAQLTSRHCTLNTYSTNIRTEYFKHAA
jgi:hypothetical protein